MALEKYTGANPFAPWNPLGANESSQATIIHSQLAKGHGRVAKEMCVGTKALQLAQRPQALIYAMLDRLATESASCARVIYPAITTSTLNQRLTKPVDCGSPGDLVTLHVVNSAGLQPQDLLTVAPYGEQFWIVSVPTNSSIDAMRVGNFPSMPIPAHKILAHTGNAVAEGSMRRLGRFHFNAEYKSQSFIVRNGWSETGTVAALRSKEGCGDLVMSNDRPGMIMDHAMDINKIILYGQSFRSMQNGMPFSMGDGIISAVRLCAPQNMINIAGPIDLKILGRLVQQLSKVPAAGGIENKLQVYCDYTSWEAWQLLGETNNGIQINQGTNTIGLVFSNFVIGGSTIEVFYDKGMDENAAAEGISDGFMFFFNPASVAIDYMPGRRGQTSSYDGMGGNSDFNSADIKAESILSEFHILHKAPHANGILTGFNCNMVKPKALLTIAESKGSYFRGSCDPEQGMEPGCGNC
uniref:Uncharacterized protein n=1 Tax=uncultured Thiotrichaceae bacterium TaxID=298394 RepID=A0A6S6U750_9GAMM|nr:MAG: Unknown protein [uncultured Thiotrichaceae bacterium]